jgi:hypothetical protein
MGIGASALIDTCPMSGKMTRSEKSHYLTGALAHVPDSENGRLAKNLLNEILEKSKSLHGTFDATGKEAMALKDEFRIYDLMCQNLGLESGRKDEVTAMHLDPQDKQDEALMRDFSDLGAKRFKVWQKHFDGSSIKEESWMRFRCRDNMLRSEDNRRHHDLYNEFILGNDRPNEGFDKYYERLAQASLGREKIRALSAAIEQYQGQLLDSVVQLSNDTSYEGNLIQLEKKVQEFLNTVASAGDEEIKRQREAVHKCMSVDRGDWNTLKFWKNSDECSRVLKQFMEALRAFYKDVFTYINQLINALSVLDRQLLAIRDLAVEYVSMGTYSLYVEEELITLADRARRLISKICAKAVQILNQAERTDPKQMACMKVKVGRLLDSTTSNEQKVNALEQFVVDALDGIRRKGSGLRSLGGVGPTQRQWAIGQMAELNLTDSNRAQDPQRDEIKSKDDQACQAIMGGVREGRVDDTL